MEEEIILRHHNHQTTPNQCSSFVTKRIKAPVNLVMRSSSNSPLSAPRHTFSTVQVWSLVRRFDRPQGYKPFVSRCVMTGEMNIGSIREVNVKSGLPATTSMERLELLDDREHILGVRIVGGDHRLKNYSSIMTLHPVPIDGKPGTLVIESFTVDVPEGNTGDETIYFVKALIGVNIRALGEICERTASNGWVDSDVVSNMEGP